MAMTREEKIAALKGAMTRQQKIAALKEHHSGPQDAVFNVQDEASPDVSFGDRFVAKNFANSPQSQAAYLKQEHPDLDVQVINGQVAIKKPTDTSYRVLDPSSLDLQDVTDLAYDIPAGAIQGLATTAGAIGGLATPVPGGAMMGGMAASGASAAGLEGLRQKLGQWLGIPQEVDGKQVAMTGAIGTVSPLVFGAGKLPSSAIASYAAKNGLSQEAAQQTAEGSTKGLLSRGLDLIPKLASKATGVNEDAIGYMANNPDVMAQLKQEGVTGTSQRLSDKVNDFAGTQRTQAGQAVQSAMDGAGKKVDVTGAKKAFLDRINLLGSKSDITKAEQAELNSLKSEYNKYFGLANPEQVAPDSVMGVKAAATDIPDQVDATRAFDLQKKLKQAAAFETNMTPETLSAKGSARGAYGALNQGFEDATNGLSQDAKDAYGRVLTINDMLEPKFKDAQTAFNTAISLDKNGKRILNEQIGNLNKEGLLNIQPELEQINAYNQFYGPQQKTPPLGTVFGSLGTLAGYKMGGGYSGAAVGGATGAAVGNALASREMLEKGIKASMAMKRAGQYLQPPTGYAPLVNSTLTRELPPWLLMDAQGLQPQQP